MKQGSLLFYAAATGNYLTFFPLYAYFAHLSNPGASFEFIVDDIKETENLFASVLKFLRNECGVSVGLRDKGPVSTLVAMDNTLRFIVEPTQKAEYVYIGDIDIMLVEDVMSKHRPVFDAGLPYSNMIRPGTKRLTGLHFTKYDSYFPFPKFDDILSSFRNDEEVLYHIVERSGRLKRQPEIDAVGVGRPQHGIHVSLNRIPFSDHSIRVDWGISWAYAEKTNALMSDDLFWNFINSLPYASRLFLANVYYIQRGMVDGGKALFDVFVKREQPKDAAASIFSGKYHTNAWGGTKSSSGPSSSMKRTQTLREQLPHVIEKYGIKIFLDAPCGDFHWMKSLAPNLPIHYIGADIVNDLICENVKRHKHENVSFINLDLGNDRLPAADILFCRDCLFHLSYRDIAKVFRNFLASECRLLMTTSHINKIGFLNSDVKTGDWRWFDLFKTPFEFPSNYIEAVPDGGGDRHMYLWRREDIGPAMEAYLQKYNS